MGRDGWTGENRKLVAGSRPNRRTFLGLGVGCAVPLLIGGTMGDASPAVARTSGQPSADPVMDHINRELMRVYREMRGAASIRGEHVRTLAGHLDLLGAHLHGRKDDGRVDAAIRRRLREKGREATAQELVAGYGDLAAGLSAQYGMVWHGIPDQIGAGAALDVLAAQGIVATLRGHRVGLHGLAAAIDRAAAARGAGPVVIALRQKPGDDFLGYPQPPDPGMTWCDFVELALRCLELEAGVLAVLGFGALGGALALAAEALDLVRYVVCRQMTAP